MSNPDATVYAKMQTDDPLFSYKKTILGIVVIRVLNPFSDIVEEVFLEGNPNKNDSGCFFDVWTEKQNAFFRNANKYHLSNGVVILNERPKQKEKSEEEKLNTMTDDEVVSLVNSKFLKLTNTLNKITSIAQVYRIVMKAEELEKSEKILRVMKARMSELQESEYS